MRISDWSSDVCSSDLGSIQSIPRTQWEAADALALTPYQRMAYVIIPQGMRRAVPPTVGFLVQIIKNTSIASIIGYVELSRAGQMISDATFRSEEHTSELQSLMRISYAVFCLKKKTTNNYNKT